MAFRKLIVSQGQIRHAKRSNGKNRCGPVFRFILAASMDLVGLGDQNGVFLVGFRAAVFPEVVVLTFNCNDRKIAGFVEPILGRLSWLSTRHRPLPWTRDTRNPVHVRDRTEVECRAVEHRQVA